MSTQRAEIRALWQDYNGGGPLEGELFISFVELAIAALSEGEAPLKARKLHIALNVEFRRLGSVVPACDGPDCTICQLLAGEAPMLSLRAMLEHLASDTCRGNRHEVFLENCPVCVSRLQRLEVALAEGETSGALEIAPGVFRATTSSSIFPEGRAAPPPEPPFTDWAEDLTSSRENYGFDNYVALLEEGLRKAYRVGRAAPEPETGWQPMTTAPKDGRHFLAATKFMGQPVVEKLWWDLGRWCGAHGEQRFNGWQPLPPPPAPEREEP